MRLLFSKSMVNTIVPAVKAVIIKNGKFLVLRQHITEDFEIWDLPGGRVEYGESPYDTLHREVAEEVGLAVTDARPIGLWWFFRKKDGGQIVCTTFRCTPNDISVDLQRNPSNEERIQEYRWVTKQEFLTNDYPVSHDSLKQLIAETL